MQYAGSITDVLSENLDWHRARLKFMSRFMLASIHMRTTDLWTVALALKANVKRESNHRRIQRFLAEYEVDFTDLGRFLLDLLPQDPPFEVVVDRTEWEFGETPVNILVMGIVHNKMAFPIAWTSLPDEGGSGADDHIEVLERFLQIVDPDSIKVAVADREFISARWLKRLQEEEIPFSIRIRIDRQVGDSPDGAALAARMYARTVAPGEERVLHKTRYLFGSAGNTGKDAEADATEGDVEEEIVVPVRVVIRRIGSSEGPSETEDPFLILATSAIDPGKASAFYRRRWEIETMFAALKSRGFDLEETNVTEPGRIENLMGLLALSFMWCRLVGEQRMRWDGPIPRKTHGRRQWSVFRYGLDMLTEAFSAPERQDSVFFRGLSGLRSPTAWASCM